MPKRKGTPEPTEKERAEASMRTEEAQDTLRSPNGEEQEETVEQALTDFPLEIDTPAAVSSHLKILIYADPGVGKTYFLGTADSDKRLTPALLVDTEGGTLTIRGKKNIDVVRVRSYEDIVKLINHLRMPNHSKCSHRKWKSIMIDSLTELQKQIMQEILRAGFVKNPSKDPDIAEMRDWGKNAERVRKVVRAFRDLEGYHIIFTLLQRDIKDDNSGIVTIKPSLPGQLADDIAGFIDIVGFLQIVRKEESTGEGDKKTKKVSVHRRMVVQPITRAIAKDRSDVLGEVIDEPTLPKMLDAIAKEVSDGSS
jgi:phage nucleotide-binding protein